MKVKLEVIIEVDEDDMVDLDDIAESAHEHFSSWYDNVEVSASAV